MKKSIFLWILISLCLLFCACSTEEKPGVTVDPALEAKLKMQFEGMYDAFNRQDFDAYASNFRLSGIDPETMANNFKTASSSVEQKYTMEEFHLLFTDAESGLVSIDVTVLDTSKTLADGITRVFREKMSCTLLPDADSGVYYINYAVLEDTEIVDVPSDETETLSPEEYANLISSALAGETSAPETVPSN